MPPSGPGSGGTLGRRSGSGIIIKLQKSRNSWPTPSYLFAGLGSASKGENVGTSYGTLGRRSGSGVASQTSPGKQEMLRTRSSSSDNGFIRYEK